VTKIAKLPKNNIVYPPASLDNNQARPIFGSWYLKNCLIDKGKNGDSWRPKAGDIS
jgi:hypothetical protein